MEKAVPVKPDSREPVLHLGWDGETPFEVDANVLATGRTCVIGASGSGKSYAVGVICEELCKGQVPFAIVDTEGEHSGLKEKYDVVWVADDPSADAQWSNTDPSELAGQALDIAPLVLDVSETDKPREVVGAFLSALYQEVERRRTPYLVIVEEADRFVPQNGERLAIVGEIARRGRKRGMGLMVCTQRPSLVDKNILSQCGNQLVGKLVIKNDLQAVSQFFSGHELPRFLTTLQPGRFYAMGGLSSSQRSITVRKKDTRYGGTTPKLGARVLKPFVPGASKAARGRTQDRSKEGVLGINPAFRPEDVPNIVKRDKSFIFFGKEETVANAELVLRPMVELGVAVKTGRIKKRIEMRYLIVDGQTGKFVELGQAPVMFEGFQRLVGLTSDQIQVLRTTPPDKDMSVLEIANKLGVSKEILRKPIRLLEQKRLIRTSGVGRVKLYRRIFSFPDPQWHESERPLETVEAKGRVEEYRLDEGNVREVVRGLMPHSDVQSFRRFVYPLYRVELIMRRRRRVVWLDGTTGKEVHP